MRSLYKNKSVLKANRTTRGSVVVEFALVLIPLLIVIAGIIEFGRTFWYYDALTKATRDGARFLSKVSVADVGSLALSASAPADCTGVYTTAEPITANTIVYCAAIAANVPSFAITNVNVQCDGAACVNGTRPQYVRVSIEDYPVTIGGWIPFFLPAGGFNTWTVTLSPETTMRYIN